MKAALFFARHARLARFIVRGPVKQRIASSVWRELEATPGFNESMARAEAELAAGKGIRYRVYRGDLVRDDE